MVFFDASGKRWKRVKLSAFGIFLPVAAAGVTLVAGALLYQPTWGILSFPKSPDPAPKTAAASRGLAISAVNPPTAVVKPNSSKIVSKSASSPATVIAYQPTAATSGAVSTPASPSVTTTPSSTTTAPTASSTPPGNSPFGHSHQPPTR